MFDVIEGPTCSMENVESTYNKYDQNLSVSEILTTDADTGGKYNNFLCTYNFKIS